MILLTCILLLCLTFSLTIINKLLALLKHRNLFRISTKDLGVLIWFSIILVIAIVWNKNINVTTPSTYIRLGVGDLGALAFFIYMFSIYSGYDIAITKKELSMFILLFPIGEEILFRGIIQSIAENYMNVDVMKTLLFGKIPFYAVVSAFCFGITHLQYKDFKLSHTVIKQVVFAFIFGLYAGRIVSYTNSIFFTIIIHSIANLSTTLYGKHSMNRKMKMGYENERYENH